MPPLQLLDPVSTGVSAPPLPSPRGPVSSALIAHLTGASPAATLPGGPDDAPTDDGQLALHLCYELTYRGLADVPDEMEWDPVVLDLRRRLEEGFLSDLRASITGIGPGMGPGDAIARLRAEAAPGSGWSVSAFMATRGERRHLTEFLIHRSAYQLKEADPHTWALPRLSGEAKAAMVEIQADEYGRGVRSEMHAELFAVTLAELGIDARYGAHIDLLPGVTLATGNLISLFGLHRRWRGALVGHLALFEMTSIGPMARYAQAFDRLGLSAEARRFYDVHVEADAHHEVVALERMVTGLLAQEPMLAADVAFGAAALTEVERRFSDHLRERWGAGVTSLRTDGAGGGAPR